jgi:hypothetical protein
MERQPDVRSTHGSPEVLRELVASIGKLDRLLESAVEPDHEDQPGRQRSPARTPSSAAPTPTVATGLKAEGGEQTYRHPGGHTQDVGRRYRFLRLVRSTNGY